MYHCTSSDHGRSFCLGTVPNGFHNVKVLMPTTHPKLLTAPKVPKKKKKKQKDERNKSPDVSEDKDQALQPGLIFDDPKRLQADVTSAMKSNLMDRLIELLNFSVWFMYKLAIHDRLQYQTNPALPPIPHEVDDVWIEHVPADQPFLYACPMPTMASVHTLTARELLECPTLGVDVEPADEELLDTPIFDLNIAKLPPSTDVSALPMPAAPSDITATATQITNFLKLMLNEISNLAPVPMDKSIPIQPATMHAERNTATNQTLMDIPQESTIDQSMSMDVVPVEPAAMLPPMAPAVDPRIFLATPAILPGPPIITTIAPPDQQWQALAAALTAYHFPSPLPSMLFPEHHWMDYPDTLKEEIQRILLPQPTPAAPVPQDAQLALVIAQAAIQPPTPLPPPPVSQPPPPGPLLPPTAPVDVQTPQPPSTSMPALDHHGQPIRRPGHYEHSVKRKQHLQGEAEYRKSHKTHMTDEPRTRQTPPPSTWHTECGKTPRERTTRRC
uniref:Uncharacterized protein n=1 Tax=Romanomermis culicivorax TaxID=13658 RepID=A0A915J238_ROMCU